MTVLKESPDSAAAVSIKEIDFSKYRSKELANRIGDLLSLPKSVGRLALTILICMMFGMALIYVLMKVDDQGWPVIIIGEAYGFPACILFGAATWIVLMIHRSLSSLTAIVDLLLATTIQIVKDYKSLGSGKRKLPPMAKLVGAVYEHVFLHVFRETLSSATGFLGRPLYWIFSLTVGRMLGVVVKKVATWTASDDDQAAMQETIDGVMLNAAENEAVTLRGLEWARTMIDTSGNWLSKRLLWPCYVILCIFFAVLIAPIVVMLLLR